MQLKLKLIFLSPTLLTLTSFSQGITKKEDYSFRKYPVNVEIIKIVSKSLIFGEKTYRFKTKIINALKDRPNFAGHCIVVEWGCGTSCQQSAIINLKTKKVSFGPNSSTGFIYYPNSKLLISNPVAKDTPDYISKEISLYLMKDEKLKLLKTIEYE